MLVLFQDYSVDCNTSRQHYFELFAALMIVIWPIGVPLLFASLLYHFRWELSENEEDRRAIALIGPIRILFEGYQPKYFFWELVSTTRRLFLIGFLVVVAQGSLTQLASGLLVSLSTITIQARYWPYNGNFDNAFALLAEWLVYLALFLAL
jgi:hypothetical protein